MAETKKEKIIDVKNDTKDTAAKTDKTAAVKSAAKKTVEKAEKVVKSAAKTAKKKTSEVKKSVKEVVSKDVVILQISGKDDINLDSVIDKCKNDYKAKGHRAPKNITVYVKPEDGCAYYTVNGKGAEDFKVEL